MANIASNLEQLSKEQLISLMVQMVQLYPDLEELIKTIPSAAAKQQRIPLNAALFRRQIAEIFANTERDSWGSEGRAAEPLLRIVAIADNYVKQGDYTAATTLYELVITGIIDNYDTFRWHAYEGDLDDVVKDCVNGLGESLKNEQATSVREKIIQTLYSVYDFDTGLENDEPVMSRKVPTLLVRYTTPAERVTIASWVREAFDYDVDWHADDLGDNYNEFLLGLEADTIDDETFLRIAHETESYNHLIDRLLKLRRLDEAMQEAKQVDNYDILEIADIFSQHGHEDVAEQLILERVKKHSDTDLLHWLKKRYEDRGDTAAVLDMAQRIFRAYPMLGTLEGYQEIRELAKNLNRWEAVQTELLTFLTKEKNYTLLIKIALDEKQIDKAIALLQSQKKPAAGTVAPYGNNISSSVAIEVAQAAEERDPLVSLEIYQRYVEKLIADRGRGNYQVACQHLKRVRHLYQTMGKSELWTDYITTIRDK
ncbi:MAG: hypothetical protein ABI396_04135, partial [Ktedonobacteraceae bacterium]